MILGILSDTHGHLARTQQAGNILLEQEASAIIHCGDIGSEAVLIELAAIFDPADIPVHAVLGNVDVYNDDLIHFPETTCIRVQRFAELELGGHAIAIIHGDDYRYFEQAVMSGRFEYVFTGHTHERDDRTVGDTRIINPGAVYRAAELGCATLNLTTGKLRYFGFEG